jgi:hypothetical protein
MVLSVHAIAANDTWTAPAGMNERIDTQTATTFISVSQNDVLQQPAGAVSESATAVSTAANGVNEIFALQPQAATSLGSATRNVTSPATGVGFYTDTLASGVNVTFNLGDRLEFDLSVNDSTNCTAALTYDSETENSNINVATIVPEGVAGLLLLAPALPFGARWWKRRRP